VSINSSSSYNLEDPIYFDYEIYSDISQEIYYFADFNCPNAPIAPIVAFSAEISPVSPIKKRVYYPNISQQTESQNCSAVVFIKYPERKIFTKNFSFIAKESIDILINLCQDSSCYYPARVFERGSEVYFNYTISNNLSQLDKVEAKIIYPNGKEKGILVPGEESFNEIGTYYLEIVASKEGYKGVNKSVMFSIIKESANINYSNISSLKEPSFVLDNNRGNFYSTLLISLIVSFLLVLLIYFTIKFKKG